MVAAENLFGALDTICAAPRLSDAITMKQLAVKETKFLMIGTGSACRIVLIKAILDASASQLMEVAGEYFSSRKHHLEDLANDF